MSNVGNQLSSGISWLFMYTYITLVILNDNNWLVIFILISASYNHAQKYDKLEWSVIYCVHTTSDTSTGGFEYRQTSNIRQTLVGNKLVHDSNAVVASPVSAAPTAYPLST